MTRFTPLDRALLKGRQALVYDAIQSGRRGAVLAPHHLLLRSPELADHAQQMGAYLRYDTVLEPRLSELVILLTAQHWSCAYEWTCHEPIARRSGLTDAVISAIACQADPSFERDDERDLYVFSQRCLAGHSVDDRLFQSISRRFGERGMVEIVCLIGYYSMLAMLLNTFETPGCTSPPPVSA